MSQLTIELPESVTAEEARLLLAIQLFEDDRISSGKAAEIARLTKVEFIHELGKRNISIFDDSAEELARDLEAARAADRHRQ